MIKFHICKNPAYDVTEIYITAKGGHGQNLLVKPMDFIFEETSVGTYHPPSIRLDNIHATEFLTALAEALDEKGIKTDKDAKIQGTLEATRYHLEDLRELLKLKGIKYVSTQITKDKQI